MGEGGWGHDFGFRTSGVVMNTLMTSRHTYCRGLGYPIWGLVGVTFGYLLKEKAVTEYKFRVRFED